MGDENTVDATGRVTAGTLLPLLVDMSQKLGAIETKLTATEREAGHIHAIIVDVNTAIKDLQDRPTLTLAEAASVKTRVAARALAAVKREQRGMEMHKGIWYALPAVVGALLIFAVDHLSMILDFLHRIFTGG